MTKNDIVFSLDGVGNYRYMYGGKLAGLYDLKYLLKRYNIMYKTNFVVPTTYAIPTSYFYDYQDAGRVPDEVVNAAMDCLGKLGGNVAVRSSADVEDRPGKTYSGQFESVLNVKTRAQMVDALNKVYASAVNVPGAQMGVILQSMVPVPKMAGVAYSETWYSAPFVVLNYVENEYADKILSDDAEPRKRFATSKDVIDTKSDFIPLGLSNVNKPDEYDIWMYKHMPSCRYEQDRVVPVSPDEREKYKNHFLISALVCELERDLGHPIDMEFVVDGNGVINVVQQRSYALPEFHKMEIDEHTTSVFSLENIVLGGTVGFVDYPHPNKSSIVNGEYDLYMWKSGESVHFFKKNSVWVYKTFLFSFGESPFAAQYTHHGNMKRENLDFTTLETWGRQDEFKDIHEGDYIMIDMLHGRVIKNAKQR